MWYILLLLIATATAFPISSTSRSTTSSVYYDSALGYRCDSNDNCGGLVGNSMCANGICACQPGYVPQGTMNCVYNKGINKLFSVHYLLN